MWFRLGETEMSRLFKNRAFKVGFSIGVILFLIIHFVDFLAVMNIEEPVTSQISIGLVYYFGFPFPIFEWNHYSPIARQFRFFGLVANIFVAAVFSFVLSFISKFVWSQISSHRVKLK